MINIIITILFQSNVQSLIMGKGVDAYKEKHVCNVDQCGAVMWGTDLKRHYETKSNFTLLKELCVIPKENTDRILAVLFIFFDAAI